MDINIFQKINLSPFSLSASANHFTRIYIIAKIHNYHLTHASAKLT